jgi:hypothetical protein
MSLIIHPLPQWGRVPGGRERAQPQVAFHIYPRLTVPFGAALSLALPPGGREETRHD